MRAERKKKETTLVPSSASPPPSQHGPLLRRNPSLSAVCLQTPRLGHAQRYLNVFGVSVFLARHEHADNIPEERTRSLSLSLSRVDLWFRGTR